MIAKGTFEVDMTPQEDVGFSAGRMLLSKQYSGAMKGSASGQMISKRFTPRAIKKLDAAMNEARTNGFEAAGANPKAKARVLDALAKGSREPT